MSRTPLAPGEAARAAGAGKPEVARRRRVAYIYDDDHHRNNNDHRHFCQRGAGAQEGFGLRITKEEAEQNRARILESAAGLFREKGFDGVGVAELMQAAGLTHGGFYNHFASKEELEAAICDLTFEQALAVLEKTVGDGCDAERKAGFADYVSHYLSAKARDAPAARCPMVALTNDAVRHGTAVRAHFAQGVRRYIDALTAALAPLGRSKARATDQVRAEAVAVLAMLVGGLLLARGVKDADRPLSDEILAALRNAVSRRTPHA
jgi:TetR/AcrR family transcriptional regulator, transcriptional repressor for nem operon